MPALRRSAALGNISKSAAFGVAQAKHCANFARSAKLGSFGEYCADPATPQAVSLVQLRIPGKAAPPTARRGFLPTTRAEMKARAYSELDVLTFTGHPYLDHAALV